MNRQKPPVYMEGPPVDPLLRNRVPRRVGPQSRFKPGSPASQSAEWLEEAGLAGVDQLNGPDVLRLASSYGAEEVVAALGVAKRVTEETGEPALVLASDLITLARLAQASRSGRIASERVEITSERLQQEREIVYGKIAGPAGRIALSQLESTD